MRFQKRKEKKKKVTPSQGSKRRKLKRGKGIRCANFGFLVIPTMCDGGRSWFSFTKLEMQLPRIPSIEGSRRSFWCDCFHPTGINRTRIHVAPPQNLAKGCQYVRGQNSGNAFSPNNLRRGGGGPRACEGRREFKFSEKGRWIYIYVSMKRNSLI